MIQAALRLSVTLTLGILAVPLLAGAQPTAKIPRIGVLQVGSATATESLFEAFKQGMREHGYVEGQHVVFERRLDRLDHPARDCGRDGAAGLVRGPQGEDHGAAVP